MSVGWRSALTLRLTPELLLSPACLFTTSNLFACSLKITQFFAGNHSLTAGTWGRGSPQDYKKLKKGRRAPELHTGLFCTCRCCSGPGHDTHLNT